MQYLIVAKSRGDALEMAEIVGERAEQVAHIVRIMSGSAAATQYLAESYFARAFSVDSVTGELRELTNKG